MKYRTIYGSLPLAALLIISHACASGAQQPGPQIAFNAPAAVDSDSLQHMRSQAKALFMAMQFEQAAQQWRSICQLRSASSFDYYWLGESLYHCRDYAEAAQAFEYGLQKGPRMDVLYPRLAETYLALKQADKVRSICSQGAAVVTDPYIRKQLDSYSHCSVQPRPRLLDRKHNGPGQHEANG